jgi:FMN phosphatase YigB (HAD superfamily)
MACLGCERWIRIESGAGCGIDYAMIKAVIFDIGNVLLSFDFGRVLRRIVPHCGVNPADFSTRLEPLKMDLESGRISADAFLDRASVALAYRGERSELVRAWQEIFEPIEKTHRLVDGLASRFPLYLLSNTNNLHAEYFMGEYPVFRRFKDRVFSHEAGLMKPDPGIYRHALEKFGLEAGEAFFVDDLAENVEAARGEGIQSHQYDAGRHELLENDLRAAGVL